MVLIESTFGQRWDDRTNLKAGVSLLAPIDNSLHALERVHDATFKSSRVEQLPVEKLFKWELAATQNENTLC